MRVRVKICGVTTPDAARTADAAGADAVGFVFAASPRRVTVETARELACELSPLVARVAVFRLPDIDDVAQIVDAFDPDIVQTEPTPAIANRIGARLFPVFHDGDRVEAEVRDHLTACEHPTILFEGAGRGGRGERPSWSRAATLARHARLVLAGGLHPDNVGDAIHTVRPYGVDVSSGVESAPGVKSEDLIHRFIEAVRDATAALGTT